MSQTEPAAAKTGAEAAFAAFAAWYTSRYHGGEAWSTPGRVWGDTVDPSQRAAWGEVAEAVAAPLRARIAELEADLRRFAEAAIDWNALAELEEAREHDRRIIADYRTEVDRLRARIAELRQDLAAALENCDRAVGHTAELEQELLAVTRERDSVRALTAEILDHFGPSGSGHTARVGQVQIAKWRKRAGLDAS